MRGNSGRAQEHALRDSQAAVYWLGGDPRWQPPGIRPLDHTVRADVCIVGGGFSGLWAALWVKRLSKDAQVVLIEREFCGAGASGRNGGWVNGWEDSIETLLKRFGQESTRWLVEASLAGAQTIREVVAQGGIDCDLIFKGGLEIAMSAAQKSSLDESLVAAERIGRPELLAPLSREEARDACGSPLAEGGVRITNAGSVQPALLVQGLRHLAIEAGVQVFEASPLTRLERTVPVVVETPAGSVIADRVVLTCGAWLARLRELRRTLFIIPSHVVATAPSPKRLEAMGWRHGQPFVDGRTAVHYGQRTTDDRLVFGRGGGRLGFAGRIIAEHFHDDAEVRAIVADMHALFPTSRDMAVEWRWGGPVERTQHGTPWVGALGPHDNLHYGVGYSGNGVCPSQVIGRTLASVALRLDDEYACSPLVSEPPSYLPPEPVRSIGARAVRAAITRSEEQADQGRMPGPLTRLVSRGLDFSLPRGLRTRPKPRSDAF